ncbi:MAG: hypothetical protein EB015_09270 [Methylocystaceae bacterium]|nr:hypothetical protein [Methylocystaceae bacterium]
MPQGSRAAIDQARVSETSRAKHWVFELRAAPARSLLSDLSLTHGVRDIRSSKAFSQRQPRRRLPF